MPRAPIPREGPHCWSRLCCRPRLKRQVLLNSLYSACQSQSPSVSLILCIELIPSYLCTLPEVKMKPAHPSWGAALELSCGVSSGVTCLSQPSLAWPALPRTAQAPAFLAVRCLASPPLCSSRSGHREFCLDVFLTCVAFVPLKVSVCLRQLPLWLSCCTPHTLVTLPACPAFLGCTSYRTRASL